MKFTPAKFDNSDKAISKLKEEHSEAQQFVWDWMVDVGYTKDQTTRFGLDFDDIFAVMAEYKRCLNTSINLQDLEPGQKIILTDQDCEAKIEIVKVSDKAIHYKQIGRGDEVWSTNINSWRNHSIRLIS